MTTVDLLAAVVEADRPPPRGPLGLLLVGALALALGAAALFATAVGGVHDREARLAVATQAAQATAADAARLAPFLAYEDLATARLASVRLLASARFPWERVLDDVTRVLPADAKIGKLDGSVSIEGGGGALRGANPAPALSLTGCLGSQGRVPELVSQLQAVRGVTEVALASSGDDGGADSPATCAKGGPTFDVVAFFGGWKDPTAADEAPTAATPAAGDGK